MKTRLLITLMALGVLTLGLDAGPLRDKLLKRQAQKNGAAQKPSVASKDAIHLTYGDDPDQTLDLYLPDKPHSAPIIIMVHGGGWKYGSKESSRVVDNKLAYWGAKGYIFVSIDYRMVPKAGPDVQAQDVARAIAKVQAVAPQYHGDPNRIIAMGHSAGAHLVALLSANPALATAQGATKWRATVVLDSGAMDVPAIMNRKHAKFYDEAFGTDAAFWVKTSPAHALKAGAIPMLLVCSTKRPDDAVGQARAFQAKLKTVGQDAPVLPQSLSHGEVNETLGLAGAYTEAVQAFIESHLTPTLETRSGNI